MGVRLPRLVTHKTKVLPLNEKQQREVEILTRLQAGSLDVATAAELLGVSARQVRRRRARFSQEGRAAVMHGNTGRAPANRTAPALLERIVALAGADGRQHEKKRGPASRAQQDSRLSGTTSVS